VICRLFASGSFCAKAGVAEADLRIFRVDLFAARFPSLRKCLCHPVELLALFETGYVFFTNLSQLYWASERGCRRPGILTPLGLLPSFSGIHRCRRFIPTRYDDPSPKSYSQLFTICIPRLPLSKVAWFCTLRGLLPGEYAQEGHLHVPREPAAPVKLAETEVTDPGLCGRIHGLHISIDGAIGGARVYGYSSSSWTAAQDRVFRIFADR
jgi:hypothetical protein